MTPQEKIVDRIRKLLALSKSSNEHEAASAAEKAAELMREYQIEEATLRPQGEASKDPITRQAIFEGKNRIQWKMDIVSGLTRAFGGYSFWGGANIMIFGRASEVQTVTYMANYLWSEIDRLAELAFMQSRDYLSGVHGKGWKHSFRLGAAFVIHNRLVAYAEAQAQKDRVTQSTALAVVQRDKLEVRSEWENYSRGFKGIPRNGQSRNAGAYQQGAEAGHSVRLSNNGPALGVGNSKLRG